MRPVPAHRARPCPARWSCTSSYALTRWLTEEREMMSRMKGRTALATIAAMTALVIAAWVATPRAQTAGERIGQVTFATSCGAAVQKPFERGVALLHSFWYIEAAKAFTAVTQADPDCAIAYWGLAMSQWTQIWPPPQPAALKRGWDAVETAKAASAKTPRARHCIAAASRYAQFAPSVPHALHMPSHTYVLLGMWTETIQSNVAAAAAEKDRGNPDDRMHALDYLVYGYLQQAQDGEAKKIVDEARGIMTELAARNHNSGRATAAFPTAAIEAPRTTERGRWAQAAAIEPRPTRLPPTAAMIHL